MGGSGSRRLGGSGSRRLGGSGSRRAGAGDDGDGAGGRGGGGGEQREKAIDAERPAYGGHAGALQLRAKVVAAAREHRVARPAVPHHELEGGGRVVVEPAHEAAVDGEGHAQQAEAVEHGLQPDLAVV